MTAATIEIKTTIELDIDTAAKWFCNLNDEMQADFLVSVQKHSIDWSGYSDPCSSQWYYMARHLATCACSNKDTREMIRYWAETLGEEQ
jgi:hypothetical protein